MKTELKRFAFKIHKINNGLIITTEDGQQVYCASYADMLKDLPNMVSMETQKADKEDFVLDVILSVNS